MQRRAGCCPFLRGGIAPTAELVKAVDHRHNSGLDEIRLLPGVTAAKRENTAFGSAAFRGTGIGQWPARCPVQCPVQCESLGKRHHEECPAARVRQRRRVGAGEHAVAQAADEDRAAREGRRLRREGLAARRVLEEVARHGPRVEEAHGLRCERYERGVMACCWLAASGRRPERLSR